MRNPTRVFIVGAGNLGREIAGYLKDMQVSGAPFELGGFLDDDTAAMHRRAVSLQVVARIDDYEPRPDDRLVIGVGEPAIRRRLSERLASRDSQFLTLAHPLAYVAESARLGEGCMCAPFSFVGPGARLGDNVVLNTFASVGHDADVGEFSVLSPYAAVNGDARVGREVFLGTHATVTPCRAVGSHSKISAGSVATRDVPEGCLVVGNPGKARVLFHVPESNR